MGRHHLRHNGLSLAVRHGTDALWASRSFFTPSGDSAALAVAAVTCADADDPLQRPREQAGSPPTLDHDRALRELVDADDLVQSVPSHYGGGGGTCAG